MELVIMISLAVALTAALIAREIGRNRRAHSVLLGDGFEVDLAPPWFVARQDAIRATHGDTPPRGVWSAWYRDGTLGAYVCTHASVTAQPTREALTISGARLEIIDEPDGDHKLLAAQEISVEETAGTHGMRTLEIDTSISVASLPPSPKAMLVLRLNVSGRQLERRLCPVEHRFAAAGATLKDRKAERV